MELDGRGEDREEKAGGGGQQRTLSGRLAFS